MNKKIMSASLALAISCSLIGGNMALVSANTNNISVVERSEEHLVQPSGKVSAAAKLLLKAYRKLPNHVKKLIAKYTKLNVFLSIVEHYTGALEDAVYHACLKVGMPKMMANIVTKTIMLLV